MPCSAMRQREPEVGHHRDDHAVAGEPPAVAAGRRANRARRWSPSTSCAGLVDRQHPVGVAVEGEADVGTDARRPRRWRASGWVEPQPALMLRPSGAAWSTSTWAPEAPQSVGSDGRRRRRWRSRRRRAARRAAAVERGDERRRATRVDARRRARRAPRRPGRRARPRRARASSAASSSLLDVVGQLAPAGGEELDAVVGPRVVRGRDHRAGHAPGRRTPRPPPGVGTTPRLGPGAAGDEAAGEGGLDAGARLTGVAADHEARVAAEHRRRRRARGRRPARR